MDYIELKVRLTPYTDELSEILVAELGDAGFESFSDIENGFSAYIPTNKFDDSIEANIAQLAKNNNAQVEMESSTIKDRNWNAVWESNFEPIIIDDQCALLAHFHHDDNQYKYRIVMEPKMAFGTGHHETTHLMVSGLLKFDCAGKQILDMGTGTGVLAILAAMKGAESADAIDIDTWSYESATENAAYNGVADKVKVFCGDASLLTAPEKYDLVLANINRNILLNDMPAYYKSMKPGATIFFSGILLEDIPSIEVSAAALGLKKTDEQHLKNWAFLAFAK